MTQVQTSLDDLVLRAEGGEPGAQYSLGVLFLLGEVVEQDLGASYQWLAKAACGQHPEAQSLMEKITPRHFGSTPQNLSEKKPRYIAICESIVRRLRRHIWFSKQPRISTVKDRLPWFRSRGLRLKLKFKQISVPDLPGTRP